MRFVSKSGTNTYHASMYEYLRNSAMNANTWTRQHNPATQFTSPFRYNNFGFTIGGPATIPGVRETEFLRDKLFFFVSEDWIRFRESQTNTLQVPTTLMRQGDFSELLSANNFYGGTTIIYDPATCPINKGTGCVAFPNNKIPKGRLSPNGLAIINAYPTPNTNSVSYNSIVSAAHPVNQRKQSISVDYVINSHQHLAFRRQNVEYDETLPFDQGSGLTPRYFNRPNQTNGLTWTWTIGANMVNEARVTYSLDQVYIPVNTTAPGFNRGTLGINFPYIIPGAKAVQDKIPTISGISNFSGLAGGPYPSHSGGPIYTDSDSFTIVWRNHNIKLGVEYQFSGENDNDQINVATVPGGANNQNGNFAFSDGRSGFGGTAGVGLANLALGLADTGSALPQPPRTKLPGQTPLTSIPLPSTRLLLRRSARRPASSLSEPETPTTAW
jgi:hypothetical protein